MAESNSEMFSEEEVSRHKSRLDAWVVLDGRVYDITGFLYAHPGGLEVVAGHLGTDVSKLLRSPDYHLHSRAAYEILDHCCIGELIGAKSGPQSDVFSLTHKKWREEDLVDWNKPMLCQVACLGEQYREWILSPVNHRVRLFKSDYLEICSRCPWWVVPLFWIPYTFYMMWLATTHTACTLPWIPGPRPLSWIGVVSLMPFGSLLWTLIEYCLHRFIFHMEPRYTSGLWLQFHFLMHGQHHKAPFDPSHLVFPPVPSGLIMMLIYVAAAHVFPLAMMRAMFAGGVVGYICYEMVHYYVHYGSPRPGSYLANLKSHHIAHHYINTNLGFGVSSTLWDVPFGTE